MTYSGDPFGGGDPFAGPGMQPGSGPPAPPPAYPPPAWAPQQPTGQASTLATLSIVFAFLFAPAGAALGHVALSRIQRTHEPGRERAIVGLTISYVVVVLAVIALVWWLVSDGSTGTSSVTSSPTTAVTHPTPPPRPSTTVITVPPAARPTVGVAELRVGDCLEVQKESIDKNDPQRGSLVTLYRVECHVADGVEQVKQILPTNGCTHTYLSNTPENTIFACIEDFRG